MFMTLEMAGVCMLSAKVGKRNFSDMVVVAWQPE